MPTSSSIKRGEVARSVIIPIKVTSPFFKETIEVDDKSYIGYILSEKDSVYYIADQNWEMRRIKERGVYTHPNPQSKIDKLCNKGSESLFSIRSNRYIIIRLSFSRKHLPK